MKRGMVVSIGLAMILGLCIGFLTRQSLDSRQTTIQPLRQSGVSAGWGWYDPLRDLPVDLPLALEGYGEVRYDDGSWASIEVLVSELGLTQHIFLPQAAVKVVQGDHPFLQEGYAIVRRVPEGPYFLGKVILCRPGPRTAKLPHTALEILWS